MTLRPMSMDDADFMLSLKNNYETRRFAIASHDEIKKEDHLKYLQDNIQYFRVIESENILIQEGDIQYPDRVGVVRIQNNEVSIWLDRKYWGNGIASYILEMVSEKGMTAKIVDGNISSMRAFINAGFKPISFNGTYYIFQK